MSKSSTFIQEAVKKYKRYTTKKLKSMNDTIKSIISEYMRKIQASAIRINVTDESIEQFIMYTKGEDPDEIYERFFKHLASGKGKEQVILLIRQLLNMLVLYRNGFIVTELEMAKSKAKESLTQIRSIGLHGAQEDFYKILVDLNERTVGIDREFRDVIVYLKNLAKLQFETLSRELSAMSLDWKSWEIIPEGIAEYANSVLNEYTRPSQTRPREEEKNQDLISSNSGYLINGLTGTPVRRSKKTDFLTTKNIPKRERAAMTKSLDGRYLKPEEIFLDPNTYNQITEAADQALTK